MFWRPHQAGASAGIDAGTRDPLRYLKRQLKPLRPTLTTTYTLPGGTHNAFSTKLEPIHDPECKKKDLLPADRQQTFTQSFLPGFFDAALSYGRLPVATENGDVPQ